MGMEPNQVSLRYRCWTDTTTTLMQVRLTEIALKLVDATGGMTYGELHEHCVQWVSRDAERSRLEPCNILDATLLSVNCANSGVDGDEKAALKPPPRRLFERQGAAVRPRGPWQDARHGYG